MTFKVWTKAGQQQIIRRGVVEIVRFAGEAEARGIEHPHILERGPCLTGVLEMRNIGCVCHFVEPKRHILAYRTQCRGDNEKQKHKSANAPVGFGRGGSLILRGSIGINWSMHRASVHRHPLNKSYAMRQPAVSRDTEFRSILGRPEQKVATIRAHNPRLSQAAGRPGTGYGFCRMCWG